MFNDFEDDNMQCDNHCYSSTIMFWNFVTLFLFFFLFKIKKFENKQTDHFHLLHSSSNPSQLIDLTHNYILSDIHIECVPKHEEVDSKGTYVKMVKCTVSALCADVFLILRPKLKASAFSVHEQHNVPTVHINKT